MKTNPPRSENAVVVARVLTRRSGFAAEDRPPLHRSVLAKSYFVAAVSLSIFGTTNLAQNVDNVAQREIQRRQSAIPQGEAALAQGKAAMKAKNYSLAHEEFKTAVRYLPDAVVSGKAHDEAVEGFCKSGVILAEARIAQADYVGAEAILSEILSDRYDPNCRPARELMAHLHQPGYFNKTMGPKFIAKVEEVKQLLTDADGYYQSGRYDLAFKKYEQVLNLDPYNVAARRGEEKINNTKYRYGEEAYNETRSRQLWQVEKGWEEPVHQYGQTVSPIADAFARDASGTARITSKLNTIIIPHIEFRDASIREAIDFLRQQAAANDPTPEGKRGVDIVLRLAPLGQIAPPSTPVEPAASPVAAAPGGAAAPGAATPVPARPIVAPAVVAASAIAPENARITITLNQIPLGEALRYIASQAGLKVKVEPYAVSIIPITEQSNDLITKEYRVPPGFISTALNVSPSALSQGAYKTAPGAAGTGTAKDTEESTGGHQLVNRETAKEFLEAQGVPFPPGASANFLPQSSRLIVRNTQDNMDLVDALVEQANIAGPKQVEIESKFVEITQNNLKELGFDWLLGPFKVGNQGAFGSGGTSGTGTPVVGANFPFVDPVTGNPIGQNPVTAGNRSGNVAISANALDALLFPSLGSSAIAPGIFGLAGVFTDPQFQVVIRALNQKKGVDLLSAPKVTTKSGQRAVIEIVREFRYPTTFTPPQVPSISGGSGANNTVAISVVTPTTPQTFETRNTGVTLEVEPVVGPDGVTIDLNLVPQVVEFEGFINYGSPIFGINPNAAAALTGGGQVLLTNNVINQPIFSTRKVTTSVSVWDGQTVVLGGLMREDVQKTEDKTPLIGDIPLVGRLFRTNVEQHIKRNLVIFVTARLVTPAGQPLNPTEEEEEGLLQPPVLPETPAYKK
ncbi:MAG: type II and III secretion system protein [Verrucomicrobia bacterium]|nr:MAG: type II and III secretion system protein [Verrucomicrobiota bacterium]